MWKRFTLQMMLYDRWAIVIPSCLCCDIFIIKSCVKKLRASLVWIMLAVWLHHVFFFVAGYSWEFYMLAQIACYQSWKWWIGNTNLSSTQPQPYPACTDHSAFLLIDGPACPHNNCMPHCGCYHRAPFTCIITHWPHHNDSAILASLVLPVNCLILIL